MLADLSRGDLFLAILGLYGTVLLTVLPAFLGVYKKSREVKKVVDRTNRQLETTGDKSAGELISDVEKELRYHISSLGHPLMYALIAELVHEFRGEEGAQKLRQMLDQIEKKKEENNRRFGPRGLG